MKKKGFFGGSFDPIHFGHIHLALSLLEAHALDEVVFCPAYVSPHKVDAPSIATPQARLRMTELAIAPIPQFSIYTKEIERGGVSFTSDTIKTWIAEEPSSQHFLLFSDKVLPGLERWKDVEELLALVTPLVGGSTPNPPPLPPVLAKKIEKGWTEMPEIGLSSTFLRRRLQKRAYCGHLMSREVLDFIYDNSIYLK